MGVFLLKNIEKSLNSNRATNSGYLIIRKHADEIVISASSRNRSKLFSVIFEYNFENKSSIIIESSCQWEIEGNFRVPIHGLQIWKKFVHIINNRTKSFKGIHKKFFAFENLK